MPWPNNEQPFGVNHAPLLSGLASDGSGEEVPVAVDKDTGELLVSGGGGGGGGTSSNFGDPFPTAGTAIGASGGGDMQPLLVDGNGYLEVTLDALGGSAIGQQDMADSLPVVIASDQSSITISGDVNLADVGNAAFSLGQNAAVNSLPVVLASDQSDVPVSGTITANAGTDLNTSALALDSTLTNGSNLVKIFDGTNVANVNAVTGKNGLYVSSNSATGSAVPANAFYIAGNNGGNLQGINTDGSSNLKVQVNNIGPGAGIGQVTVAASSTGAYSYVHIAAGQATTTVKSGAGTLHAIVFNSAATTTNVTTIYDSTTGSGNVIGIPAATAITFAETLVYDLAFATGLTIVTATANGGDMTVVYK